MNVELVCFILLFPIAVGVFLFALSEFARWLNE